MSCEWPVAACSSKLFQTIGGAGANCPAVRQLAPAARYWLMRARALAWKSGKPQSAAAEDGAGASGEGSSEPPPQLATSSATVRQASEDRVGRICGRYLVMRPSIRMDEAHPVT